MNRRSFIKGTAAGAAVTAGAAVVWLNVDTYDYPLTINYALQQLDSLLQKQPTTTGLWSLPEVFEHCAQSVEFSMTGYPEHKPDRFKHSLGQTAFSLFSAKGKMSHALDEPIPGAPALGSISDVALAAQRFKKALLDFQSYDGALAPHFAFGELNKQEYEHAHVMHFNNHLLEIQV